MRVKIQNWLRRCQYSSIKGNSFLPEITSTGEPFNKQSYIDLLAREGFSTVQAEGYVKLISEIVEESMAITTESLVKVDTQEKFNRELNLELHKIKKDISTIEQTDFGKFKTALNEIRAKVEEARADTLENITRVRAGTFLDINLEKNRTEKEASELGADLKSAELKIDLAIDEMKARLLKIQNNARNSSASMIS